jgi:hypothetical protein
MVFSRKAMQLRRTPWDFYYRQVEILGRYSGMYSGAFFTILIAVRRAFLRIYAELFAMH